METQKVIEFFRESGYLIKDFHFANRYRIIEQMGSGGAGNVYKAEDTLLNEIVALKLLRNDREHHSNIRKRFIRETKITRTLSHNNIVRIFDIGSVENILFISMEFIDGHDLKYYIFHNIPIGTNTRESLILQMLNGIGYAHHRGIIHRDIKPQNMMVTVDEQLKILDFGLAKAINQQSMTAHGSVMGTPEYMSPEQALGNEIDYRTDIYSIGVVLYELFSGTLPFKASNPLEVLGQHVNKEPLNPKEINPKITSNIANIILKCLRKDPAQRFQSVNEIRDLFKHSLNQSKLLVETSQLMEKSDEQGTIHFSENTQNDKILIVDDESLFLGVIHDQMSLLTENIVTTENAVDALNIVKQEEFAVIISDYQMSDMDGIAFFEKVAEISPRSKRVLLTGYPSLNVIMESINRGSVHKFFLKPTRGEILLKAIKELLQGYNSNSDSTPLRIIKKILIINDSKKTRLKIKDSLITYGETFLASDSTEAIQLIEQNSFDVIISGQELSGQSGLAFLKSIYKNDKTGPRLILYDYKDTLNSLDIPKNIHLATVEQGLENLNNIIKL